MITSDIAQLKGTLAECELRRGLGLETPLDGPLNKLCKVCKEVIDISRIRDKGSEGEDAPAKKSSKK
ncbi:unnamed protein product, partial [Prorocentrum cordatum]